MSGPRACNNVDVTEAAPLHHRHNKTKLKSGVHEVVYGRHPGSLILGRVEGKGARTEAVGTKTLDLQHQHR